MNPYDPPSAKVTDPPAAPGSMVKAICLGLLVDFGGSLLFGLAFSFVYASVLVSRGLSADAVGAALEATTDLHGIGAALAAVGGGFSVLGGYVCARVSRRSSYRPAWIMAGISVVLGLLMSWGSYAGIQHVMLAVLSTGSVLLGMRLGMPKRGD